MSYSSDPGRVRSTLASDIDIGPMNQISCWRLESRFHLRWPTRLQRTTPNARLMWSRRQPSAPPRKSRRLLRVAEMLSGARFRPGEAARQVNELNFLRLRRIRPTPITSRIISRSSLRYSIVGYLRPHACGRSKCICWNRCWLPLAPKFARLTTQTCIQLDGGAHILGTLRRREEGNQS